MKIKRKPSSRRIFKVNKAKLIEGAGKPTKDEVSTKANARNQAEQASRVSSFEIIETKTLRPFIGMRGLRSKQRKFASRPNAVFSLSGKGIIADDENYLKFTRTLSDRLTDEFDVRGKDGFAIGHPITSDFSALRTVSGYFSSPTDIPPKDNTDDLVSKGINVTGFVNSEAETIAEICFELLMEDRDDECNIKIARDSSTSIPFFTSNPGDKRKIIDYTLDHSKDIRELIMRNDLEGLAQHHVWLAYVLQVRLQAEGGSVENGVWTPKDRPVRLWNGDVVIADKTSELREMGETGHWANRVRTVFATPGSISYLLTSILTPRRKAGLHRFAFSLHHTGALDLYNKMKRFETVDIIGLDVKQMDNNYPGYYADFICDQHDKFYDPSVGRMLKLLSHAPFYSASPGDGIKGGWQGNPLEASSYINNYGLPSGIPDVSSRGKYWVLFSVIFDLQRLTGRMWKRDSDKSEIKRQIALFLSGKHEFIAIFNTGDDTVLLLNKESYKFIDELKDFMDGKLDMKPSHALYKREEMISYLGFVFMKDDLGNIIVPKPSALSYVVKPFCPERGVFDKRRSYWGAGMLERNKYYADMGDTKEAIDAVIRTTWAEVMKSKDPFQMAAAHAMTNPFPHFGGESASYEVLEDPSKLHYKYSEEDIDDRVLDAISMSYTQQELEPFYKTFEL